MSFEPIGYRRWFRILMKVKTDYLAALGVSLLPWAYFFPALRSHEVLAPYDGILQNVPMRIAAAQMIWSGHLPLWDPYIFSGMPFLAAAQPGLLYPLNWFYLIFSPAVATNLMVISSYMVAALGAYLYARRTRSSVAGAVVTSVIWQCGGFLIGQISHINIVHTAAMMPWVLWAIELYGTSGRRRHAALLAALVALQAFAGHQQAFAYSLLLVAAYALVMAISNRELRKRYLVSLGFIVAGVLISAVQLVPTFELLRNSMRQTASYEFFTSFSMPIGFVRAILAPYVLGGGDGRIFRAPYASEAFYTEYVVYAGMIGIMLAVVGLFLKRDVVAKFWVVTFAVCLVLSFGGYLPLGIYRAVYYLPVLNLFRVPARHLMEAQFALAVLAGRGLTLLADLRGVPWVRRRVALVLGAIFILTCLVVTWWRPANFHLNRDTPVSVLRAPELFLPIAFAVLSGGLIWLFVRRRRGAVVLIMLVLFVDLAVWGQSSGWYTASPRSNEEYWSTPETARVVHEIAKSNPPERILTAPHRFDPNIAPVGPSVSHSTDWVLWTQPDVYMMHGIHNAAGYDGFGLQRYSDLVGQMKVWGELTDPDSTLRGKSREIDLVNARYLLAMRKQLPKPNEPDEPADFFGLKNRFSAATEDLGGSMFAANDLGVAALGKNRKLSFVFPAIEVDRIALLTNLSWAETVPDGEPVARVRFRKKDGGSFDLLLRTGEHTSEWAHDRSDIHARVKHKRAPIGTSYRVEDTNGSYQGHGYVAALAFPQKATVTRAEIVVEPNMRWPELLLSVMRVSLVSSAENKSFAVTRDFASVDNVVVDETQGETAPAPPATDRWKLIRQTPYVDVFENARVLPRVWLASAAAKLDDQATLQVIRAGKMPNGSDWNPLQTVLIDGELPPLGQPGGGTAEITRYEPNRIEVKTAAGANSILVLSENHYPGWRAYVDGQLVETMRVDYNLRGVALTAGEHAVQFIYWPKSVFVGLIVSLITVIGLSVWSVREKKR